MVYGLLRFQFYITYVFFEKTQLFLLLATGLSNLNTGDYGLRVNYG